MPNIIQPSDLPAPRNDCPLETPGTVAVLGSGPLAIETALYGRYLGYDLHLFSLRDNGHWGETSDDRELDMMPGRSFSSLAAAALSAQQGDVPRALPMTYADRLSQIYVPLCESDLFRGRVHDGSGLVEIATQSVAPDDPSDSDVVDVDPSDSRVVEDLPPDFSLRFESAPDNASVRDDPSETDSSTGGQAPPTVFESVLVVWEPGQPLPMELKATFQPPLDYLFAVHAERCTETDGDPEKAELHNAFSSDAEATFHAGLRCIARVFAILGDRGDLDLYRPPRGGVETEG